MPMFDTLRLTTTALLVSLVTLAPACKTAEEGDDETSGSLYDRLGGEEGIRAVVEDAVVNRIAADPKINAYFFNDGVDINITINCLVDQLGALTGGPQTYPNDNCRDMKETHEGMGVSDNDFNDLAAHFVGALTDAGVAQADIDVIVEALVGMHDDIVEDPTNNATVYQRVGRQPAIQSVVTAFVDLVVADPTLMAFFTTTDRPRFEACLVRQVCGIDGPCEYGLEVPGFQPELGGSVCRDMLSSHEGLTITIEDFDALVAHLVTALDDAGVVDTDRDMILAALGPLCAEIVSDPATCQ
jgi:hemoglobin